MAIEETKIEPNEQEKKLGNYWFSCIRRARKEQPKRTWEAAEDRYKIASEKDEDKPFVNDCRTLQIASLSFLDEAEPSFKISPTEAWMGDPIAIKQAECDSAYLKYVWREQKCQRAQSRKLDSALLRNNGFTKPEFDKKKWMPRIRYLKAEHVLLDADCDGIEEEANWKGYEEDVPIEEFRSWHSDMDKALFDEIVKKAGSVLTEDERDEVKDDADKDLFKAIHIIHVYARNSAAIKSIKKEDEGEEPVAPPKRLAEELQLDTPRRYLQFVEGWPAPVINADKWPFDLDHDEFPPTHLQFNQVEDLYGFTDYQQLERLDKNTDQMMRNLVVASLWAAVRKWAGSKDLDTDTKDINDFLNNPAEAFYANLLDAEGEPKIKPIPRDQVDAAQVEMYRLGREEINVASGLSELLQNADAQTYKDVTAIAARIVDANMHQRINRRLGGPWGYEASIAEDAIKMLEIAHQFVPPLSVVAVLEQELDEMTGMPIGEPTEVPRQNVPWPEAQQLLKQGGKLIMMGVDAIVGPELAQYWAYKTAPQEWRLSTKVTVEPGTTRSITRQQQAAIMKQLYVEVFLPFYQATANLVLARDFLELIGRLAGVPNIENLLPKPDEMLAMQQMMQQMAPGAEQQGGQPLNSPEATGGELQTGESYGGEQTA